MMAIHSDLFARSPPSGGNAVAQVAALVEHCGRVREQLRSFSVAAKQQVFDALALQVG
jgi:hypothetical protein